MGAIVEFLIEPGNIETAFDISEHLPSAIDELHIRFWDRLQQIIGKRLKDPTLGDVWGFQIDPSNTSEFIQSGYAYLEIYYKLDLQVYWAFWIEQSYRTNSKKNNSVELYYGFGFHPNEQRRRAVAPEPARELITDINGPETNWIDYQQQIEDGWVARKSFEFDLRSRESMIQLARGDELEQRVANALFHDLFEPYRERLEQINLQLQQKEESRARVPRRNNRRRNVR